MKNQDCPCDRHRELGDDKPDPDGREVARKLYGGLADREPTEQEDGTTG